MFALPHRKPSQIKEKDRNLTVPAAIIVCLGVILVIASQELEAIKKLKHFTSQREVRHVTRRGRGFDAGMQSTRGGRQVAKCEEEK
jgi:hypothetical protein